MTRRAWFCYEFVHDYIPSPVVYYDVLPQASANGKEAVKPRVQTTEVTHLWGSFPGGFLLHVLSHAYPYNPPLKKETSGDIKEATMTRPVQGYQTTQGAFFDTEMEANLYEATYDLEVAATEAVAEFVPNEEHFTESLVAGIKAFITDNKELVRKYIDARAASISVKGEETTDVDRQSTEADTTDDTRVWGSEDRELDDPPATEGDTT